LENCGEVNTGRRGWSSQLGFLEATQSGSVSGSGTPGGERIRRGCIHLDVDIRELADVADVRDSIALEVQLLLSLIVFCGRAGEETSTKVLRAFAAGNAVFREQGKMPVRAGTPVRP
jgi:hypothetical protein